jgi:hypothetical protein
VLRIPPGFPQEPPAPGRARLAAPPVARKWLAAPEAR